MDNIGLTGIDSIRLNGEKIEDLPIGESARAAMELQIVRNNDRKKQIDDIIKSSPTQDVIYLESRVVECEENIDRLGKVKGDQDKLINEYTATISLCEFRDIELSGETDKDRIKTLKRKFPPYNVAAMKQQIKQSFDSVEAITNVIAQEYSSIAELKELISRCVLRDSRLKALEI